jgi:hypothetical protein
MPGWFPNSNLREISMTVSKTAIEPKTQVTDTGAISDAELDQVTGGVVRKAGEQPQEGTFKIGSQSSGAGAGKVTFDPF